MGRREVSADCRGPESIVLLDGEGSGGTNVFPGTKAWDIDPVTSGRRIAETRGVLLVETKKNLTAYRWRHIGREKRPALMATLLSVIVIDNYLYSQYICHADLKKKGRKAFPNSEKP